MVQIRRMWTEEENGRLRKLAGKVSLQEIARQLGRTEDSTRIPASKLGLKLTFAGAKAETIGKGALRPQADGVEKVVAPVAIERAISIYQQLCERDQSVVLQARKILTQHIYGLVDQGETDQQRQTVGGLIHLKTVERDHAIKSVHDAPSKIQRVKACPNCRFKGLVELKPL